MNRVKEYVLVKQDGSYYFEGHLFTGIAFRVSGKVVEQVLKYHNGKLESDYVCEFWSGKKPTLILDEKHLDEDEEGELRFFNGEPFSGLAYEFNGDSCVSEFVFDNGNILYQASWKVSGELEALEKNENGLYQDISWYKRDAYEHIKLAGETFNCDFQFNKDDGRIRTICIKGDYLNLDHTIWKKLNVHFFTSKEDASKLQIASHLFLCGNGIDEAVFKYLKSANGFTLINSISIYDTALSKDSLLSLSELKNLQEIRIEDDSGILLELTQELKKNLPECRVEFNRRALES